MKKIRTYFISKEELFDIARQVWIRGYDSMLIIADYDDIKVIRLVATTELLEVPTKTSSDIELWTYWTLKKKLQETNIDKSFIEIIENYLAGTVGRPIADLHFYKDCFK